MVEIVGKTCVTHISNVRRAYLYIPVDVYIHLFYIYIYIYIRRPQQGGARQGMGVSDFNYDNGPTVKAAPATGAAAATAGPAESRSSKSSKSKV